MNAKASATAGGGTGKAEAVLSTGDQPLKHRSVGHRGRGWLIAIFVVLGLLLLIRFVGSPIVTSVVNRKLARLEGFEGHVDSIHLALWRGAISVHDLILRERGHESDEPIVHLNKASMRLAPGALFKGKLGGAAVVDGVVLNIVKSKTAEAAGKPKESAGAKIEQKKEQAQRWQEALSHSFPVELTRLEVRNAALRYIDRTHQPVVDVGITNVHILVTDLQNRPKANGDPLPTKLQIDGVTTGNGQIHARVELDPMAKQPLFSARFEVKDLSLPPFNAFLLAYANADVSKGSFEVYMEVEAKGGGYNGYVKPLFHDLDFRTASDEHKNAAQLFTKKVVSAVASVLENKNKEQVATKAPFRGNFADNKVDIWSTLAELFRNAFVQALRGGFEGQTPRQ